MQKTKCSAKEKKPIYGHIGANLGQLRMLEKAKFLEDQDDLKNQRFSELLLYVTPILETEIKNNFLNKIGAQNENSQF